MQMQSLTIETRELTGKGPARRLRADGKIPAVVYGLGSSTPVSVNRKELARIINTGAGASTLLTLKAGNSDVEKLAILRDYQTDPIKNKLTHADFQEVAADKTIQVTVPVVLAEGDPVGVKQGGLLSHPTREIHIECLPLNIPEHIVVDASALDMGHSMHISELKLPEGVKVLSDLDLVVATISAPVSAEKLEEMLSTTTGEVSEPEVVGKAKEE